MKTTFVLAILALLALIGAGCGRAIEELVIVRPAIIGQSTCIVMVDQKPQMFLSEQAIERIAEVIAGQNPGRVIDVDHMKKSFGAFNGERVYAAKVTFTKIAPDCMDLNLQVPKTGERAE